MRCLLFNIYGPLRAPHEVKPALTIQLVHLGVCRGASYLSVCNPVDVCCCHRRHAAVQCVLGRASALGVCEGKTPQEVLKSHVSACMGKEVDGFQPYKNGFLILKT